MKQAGGVELFEEVVDEGAKTNVEHLALFALLVLEIGQHSVILHGDSPDLLAPCDAFLELVGVNPALVHVII